MKPTDILNSVIKVSQDKAEGSFAKLFILGILAGAFISFGAEGSNMAACNLLASPETYGTWQNSRRRDFFGRTHNGGACGSRAFTGTHSYSARA